jgi:hypothetical protein
LFSMKGEHPAVTGINGKKVKIFLEN